jgi:hypothetical protein
MRAGSRFFAALLAAAVWIFAAMSLAPSPGSPEAASSVLEGVATAVVSTAD